MNHGLFTAIALIFATAMGTFFVLYAVAIVIPYIRQKTQPVGDNRNFTWHFCVPCRDEDAVIGATVHYLRANFPTAHVWVIDDASEDATAAIVAEYAEQDGHVHLLRRVLPEARTGKADALNFAWKQLLQRPDLLGDPATSIMAVVDADGRPSANLLDVAAGPTLFGNATIAAVQVEVRMSNAGVPHSTEHGDWLSSALGAGFVRMQDLEFRAPISAIQLSRRYTRTVNVGGNGQLARMSALSDIAGPEGPWRGSLLEDFELGLHFILDGWRNAYTVDAWVEQEALYSLPRYLTQRARWAQGTMQCFRYLPRIWTTMRVSNFGAMELTYFLLQPWLQILGTICYPTVFIVSLVSYHDNPEVWQSYLEGGGALAIVFYGFLGMAAFAVWGPLYRARCVPEVSFGRGLLWGVGYLLYIFLIYAVVWKAFAGFLRRAGWAKTVRNAETVDLIARMK